MFYGEDKRSCTAVFCKNWGLHARMLGVCGYGYGYGWKISYPRQAWTYVFHAQMAYSFVWSRL